jgi:uncharacterized protein (DUF2236 family)
VSDARETDPTDPTDGSHGADGYFPRGQSVLRRVHGARIVGVLYGQRALLLQATHPLAFTGLTANTQGLEAPFARLAHTAKTMERIFFGTRAEADRETARVRDLHERVRGHIDEPAGRYAAGTPYAATKPEFLLWILACLADSAQCTYERFVRPLTAAELESFWQDYLSLGELFALPREQAPDSYAGFRAYMEDRLAGPDLFVTAPARELGRRVAFDLPVPDHRRPALAVINFLVLGTLPERVREAYGLPWSPAQERALAALALGLRAAARVVPARWRRGPSAGDYEVVARTEARRLGRLAS